MKYVTIQILSIQLDDFHKLNQYSDPDQETEHKHYLRSPPYWSLQSLPLPTKGN